MRTNFSNVCQQHKTINQNFESIICVDDQLKMGGKKAMKKNETLMLPFVKFIYIPEADQTINFIF